MFRRQAAPYCFVADRKQLTIKVILKALKNYVVDLYQSALIFLVVCACRNTRLYLQLKYLNGCSLNGCSWSAKIKNST